MQRQKLCGEDAKMEEVAIGHRSRSKRLSGVIHTKEVEVIWCEDLKLVPNGSSYTSKSLLPHPANRRSDPTRTPFILAHEFFDAIPIHAFQSVSGTPSQDSEIQTPTGPITLPNSTSKETNSGSSPPPSHFSTKSASPPHTRPLPPTKQWRELLVTPSTSPINNDATSSATVSTQRTPSQPAQTSAEFQLYPSRTQTRSSLLLPALSPRYASVLNSTPAGSTIEINPEAQALIANIAIRIGGATPVSPSSTDRSPLSSQGIGSRTISRALPSTSSKSQSQLKGKGAALILDYGTTSTIPTNSLRGIRSHQLVSPFSAPGLVDLSSDVDFQALVESSLHASEGVEVHGPIEQGMWLGRMGIKERADKLMQQTRVPSQTQSTKKRQVDGTQGNAQDRDGKSAPDGRQIVASQERGENREQAISTNVDVAERIRSAVIRLTERGGGAMGRLYKVLAIVPERGGKRPVGFGGEL